jgi:hypothetical protein
MVAVRVGDEATTPAQAAFLDAVREALEGLSD